MQLHQEIPNSKHVGGLLEGPAVDNTALGLLLTDSVSPPVRINISTVKKRTKSMNFKNVFQVNEDQSIEKQSFIYLQLCIYIYIHTYIYIVLEFSII